MNNPKPKVGDTLFLVDTGNRARSGRGEQRPCTVTKVGRKYFDVEYEPSAGFKHIVTLCLDTWAENTAYTVNFRAYASEQAWWDEQERVQWVTRFRQEFETLSRFRDRHSLESLREAAKALGIELEVQQ